MSFIPTIYGTIDDSNSTTTPLFPDQKFIGTGTNVTNYTTITVTLSTNCCSTKNGFQIQFSPDNEHWDLIKFYTINLPETTTTVSQTYHETVLSKFFRIVYINGTDTQTVFRLHSLLNPYKQASSELSLQTIGNSNYIQPVKGNYDGSIFVTLTGNNGLSEPRVIQPTPVFHLDFIYGINTNLIKLLYDNKSNISHYNQEISCTVSTSPTSYSSCSSIKNFKYKDGQSSIVRISGLFDKSPVKNNIQLIGVGDSSDGFFFGYNGTSFGILCRRTSSNIVSDTWIYQSDWSHDSLDGKFCNNNKSGMLLLPHTGNIYQFSITYCGYANITFFIYNPDTGSFIPIHQQKFSNSFFNGSTNISDTSLPITWLNYNTSTIDRPTTIKGVSASLFVDGCIFKNLSNTYTFSNKKPYISDETIFFSIKCNPFIKSIINKSSIILRSISFSSTSKSNNNISTLNIRTNILNSTSFVNTNSVSISSIDTKSSVIHTSSTIICSFPSIYGIHNNIDLLPYNIILNPNDIVSFSIENTSQADFSYISLQWSEEI